MLGYDEKNALNDNALSCYKECAIIIKDFLKQNKGLDNGYDTFVFGMVRYNVFDRIFWRTPVYQDMTIRQIQDKGSVLYRQLKAVIDKFDIETMKIEKIHSEDGCYNTYVSFPSYLRVRL